MPTVFETMTTTLKGMFNRGEAPHEQPYQARWAYQTVGSSIVAGHDSYDNVFPYVNAIANRFASIIPYAVNASGERIPTPPALQALYAPNTLMSCREFLQYLAASMLTNSHTDILIWNADGYPAFDGLTPDTVAGYTFLPSSARVYENDGSYYFQTELTLPEGRRLVQFGRECVISLAYARHPSDLSVGVAPAMTVTKWANVDDMLADYERGFFGNGTVPAGMIEIVAESPQDFTQTKQQIEQRFRGAKNHNSVVYNYRPADPVTHETVGDSKISWTPFTQSNDSLDLSTLNDVVNNRLANAMAVPDIVRGIDSGQTYANAEQATMTFIENTLQPLCLNVWDKWQFELDRITGGLGYGITFELDLPAQTDVEMARAETTSVNVDNLLKLIDYGATVDDAVDALGLPDEYKRLRLNPTTEAQAIEDTEPVLVYGKKKEGYAATTTSRMLQITRAIMQAVWQAIDNNEYVDIQALANQWGDDVYEIVARMILTEAQTVARKLEQSASHLDDESMTVIIAAATAAGGLLGWETLPATYEQQVRDHLKQVAEGSLTTLQDYLLQLKRAQDEGELTEQEARKQAEQYIDRTRSHLLSDNEKYVVASLGGYYAAQAIQETTHLTVYKTWETHRDDATCTFCLSMDGTTIPAEQPFLRFGDTVTVDDTDYVNDYEDMSTPYAHPNCRCTASYSFVQA